MEKKFIVTFYNGVDGPTGSNFLLTEESKDVYILIDCGLKQGNKVCDPENRNDFPYDPKKIDYLLVTHSHIDHIGRIPKLVKDGFNGKIISTAPTKDIAKVMLEDSLDVLESEAKKEGLPMIFDKKDIERSMQLWDTVDYHKNISIKNFNIRLLDAGHILGSAMIEVSYNNKKLVFTGDLGNSPSPLLRDTENINGTHFLVMESVYGDRNHEDRAERRNILEDVIENSVKKGGVLLIPAFSLERTQDLLFEINNLIEDKKVPQVPIFLDSPLAIDLTNIYKKYDKFFNLEAQGRIKGGDDIFNFPNLKFTYTKEESMGIWNVKGPKIIIAGSGMSNGGRIIHHEKKYLQDPKNTLLIIGYQVPGSLGRMLQDGEKSVEILGEKINVKAKIKTIHGYSAHKDSNGLINFVADAADSLIRVFCVLGEPKSRTFLVQRIRDYLGIKAETPNQGDTVEILVY